MKNLIETVKRVAFNEKTQQYIQLQAIYLQSKKIWIVQEYDCEFNFTKERSIKCEKYDFLDFLHKNYQIVSGLRVDVLRSSCGDCTNGGISKEHDYLYIIDLTKKLPSEPESLEECAFIEKFHGKIIAKPLFQAGKWHMMGGNFLFSADCRFSELTTENYPIPIHDRKEKQ